jgi:hypothetical protein
MKPPFLSTSDVCSSAVSNSSSLILPYIFFTPSSSLFPYRDTFLSPFPAKNTISRITCAQQNCITVNGALFPAYFLYAPQKSQDSIPPYPFPSTSSNTSLPQILAPFGGDPHEVGKKHTVGIEGNNCRLRHRIRGVFRRTCCFSKKLYNHWKAFAMAFFYINHGFV